MTASEDGTTLLTLETVPLRLRAEAAKGQLLGAAIVALIRMASGPTRSERDTIAIQIELPDAPVVVMGRTFKKGWFGYKFDEPFVVAQPIAERVFG